MNLLYIALVGYIIYKAIREKLDKKYIVFSLIVIGYCTIDVMRVYFADSFFADNIFYVLDKGMVISLACVLYSILNRGTQ